MKSILHIFLLTITLIPIFSHSGWPEDARSGNIVGMHAALKQTQYGYMVTKDHNGSLILKPLCLAAGHGKIELVKWLLTHGVNMNESTGAYVNQRDENATPIIYAALGGHYETVLWFLEHGYPINRSIPSSEQPRGKRLQTALIALNLLEIAQHSRKPYFAGLGMDGNCANAPVPERQRLIQLLSTEIPTLLTAPPSTLDPQKKGLALRLAAGQGNVDRVELLLSDKTLVLGDVRLALENAVYAGHEIISRRIISYISSHYSDVPEAKLEALANGLLIAVAMLRQKLFPVFFEANTPIEPAINHLEEMLELAHIANNDWYKNELPPLQQAEQRRKAMRHYAMNGNLDLIKGLVESGQSVNDFDSAGWQPIHWAAEYGHLPVVQYLLDNGASVHSRGSQDNKLPIHWAISKNQIAMIKYLLQHGNSLDEEFDGENILTYASKHGSAEAVEACNAFANPESQNRNTPQDNGSQASNSSTFSPKEIERIKETLKAEYAATIEEEKEKKFIYKTRAHALENALNASVAQERATRESYEHIKELLASETEKHDALNSTLTTKAARWKAKKSALQAHIHELEQTHGEPQLNQSTGHSPLLWLKPISPSELFDLLAGTMSNNYLIWSLIHQAMNDGSWQQFVAWQSLQGETTQSTPPFTMLHRAEREGHRALAAFLHEHGWFLEYNERAHPLINITLTGTDEQTIKLIAAGEPVDIRVGSDASSPVHLLATRTDLDRYPAYHQPYTDWIRLLSPNEAALHERNARGLLPVMIAVLSTSSLLREFLALHSDFTVVGPHNNTLVHLALSGSHAQAEPPTGESCVEVVINWLVKQNQLSSILEVCNDQGETPLVCAIKAGNAWAIVTLLTHGAVLKGVEDTATSWKSMIRTLSLQSLREIAHRATEPLGLSREGSSRALVRSSSEYRQLLALYNEVRDIIDEREIDEVFDISSTERNTTSMRLNCGHTLLSEVAQRLYNQTDAHCPFCFSGSDS